MLLKYGLLHLPGLIFLSGVLWLLCDAGFVSREASLTFVALWLAKDVLMYPILRRAYGSAPSELVGVEQLIGQWGVAQDSLAPSGYVQVGGERWRAECARPGARVAAHSRVRVCGIRGLTLLVAAAEETSGASGC